MNKLVLLLVVAQIFITFSCNIKSNLRTNQIIGFNKCEILDSVLNNKILMKVIDIENPQNIHPAIRFIDNKFKDFEGCYIMKFLPNLSEYIEGFVLQEPTYSLNTGQFRDIVLFDFNVSNDTLKLALSAAHMKNQAEKEGIPLFEFQFIKDKIGKIHIDKVTIRQIRESRPPVDYDKIKK